MFSYPAYLDPANNWAHQSRGRSDLHDKRAAGLRSVVGVAPPGAGKSRVMFQEAIEEVLGGGRAILCVHRQMLLEQMRSQLECLVPCPTCGSAAGEQCTSEGKARRKAHPERLEGGVPFGVIAPDYALELDKPFQLASIQTLYSRAVKRGDMDLPDSTLAILDEAHANAAEMTRSLFYGAAGTGLRFSGWHDRGTFIAGFSGSPVNLGGLYESMVNFGTYKELREVKSHAWVVAYGPEEIDVSDLATNSDGEYSPNQLEKRAYPIFGSVYDWWHQLNPFAEPALLFGPSTSGARWFAHEFARKGVTAGYIGSDCVLFPARLPTGQLTLDQYPSTPETRDQLLKLSREGALAVLCNRFVLREAIDMPWIRHGIAATVFGGLATYLQSVGRIQRYFGAYDHKIWQCHGGSFWRHGSPNAERHWALGDTNKSLAQLRKANVQKADNPQDVEGICCPKCRGWRTRGPQCPHCKHMHKRSVRFVRQIDGALVKYDGSATPRRKKRKLTEQAIWNSVLYGSVKADRAVSSAVAIFYSRAKAAGIDNPNPYGLMNAPPTRVSQDYHKSVRDVFPTLKPKA